MGRTSEVPLRVAGRRGRADEWALVLAAEKLAPKVWRGAEGFVVGVAPEDADRALAILDAYERENRPTPPSGEGAEPSAGSAPLRVALCVSGALLAFFAVTGPRDPAVRWFERGSLPNTLFPWFRTPLDDALRGGEPVVRHEYQGVRAVLAGMSIDLRMRLSDDRAG